MGTLMLLGMLNDIATLENYFYTYTRYIPKKKENLCPHKDLHVTATQCLKCGNNPKVYQLINGQDR